MRINPYKMEFKWDINKAKSNVNKHKISFDEAQTVFEDDFTETIGDDNHSREENRFITIGHSESGRLLVVCHTFEEDIVIIISARKPTKTERNNYENG